ncbi:folate-binding protein [Pseudonocardiaceae bacterium YIM PH 21723]|nr:folate-binding protein [Pseudonocardiaceae bacterium YIM PH 21723]
MNSPLLSWPGAIAAPDDALDAGVAWHFGDPFVEQRTGERTAIVVDRSNRDVIAVPGEDRLSWLHSLTSQHFLQLTEGQSTESLILDSNGRVERHFGVTHSQDTIWLDTEPGEGAALLAYLEKMRFWSKVEPAVADLGVLSVVGPQAPRVEGGIQRETSYGYDLLVPRSELVDYWKKLLDAGAKPAGSWAFEALRVGALRPRLGVDTDERTIPHEMRWIPSAVHLDKGCYRGQETVARVHNLGKPPRKLVLLHLDGSSEILPEPGEEITLDGRAVGRVGTAVRHHELGTVALALVKRNTSVDAKLNIGDIAAAIDPDSEPEDTGPQAGRQAIERLRG